MIQEEKEILLKELSVRAFYGVQAHYIGGSGHYTYEADGVVKSVDISLMNPVYINFIHTSVEHTKPYLRPMSSMTTEEQEEYDKWHQELEEGRIKDWKYAEYNDWLNAHHIDYRGLIPMGLALEAPEDMYKTE